MMAFDTLLALGLVTGAGIYLCRKFARTGKSGACGCASGGGCCADQARGAKDSCCASRQRNQAA